MNTEWHPLSERPPRSGVYLVFGSCASHAYFDAEVGIFSVWSV